MTSTLRIAYRGGNDSRPGWYIGFDYDLDLITDLKQQIPVGDRRWLADLRLWWVALEHQDKLLTLFPSFEAYLKQGQLF